MSERLMSKRIKDVLKSVAWYWRFIASTVLILTVLMLLIVYGIAHMRGETYVDVSGRAHLDFRVFYMENEIFDDNPIPQNLSFLMSFTDYIEMDSYFFAWFDEEVQIYYEYTATERLVIRHMATGDANANPIVYEDMWQLSEISGSIFAGYINSAANSNGLGGTYTVFPRPHIDTYMHFVDAQARQMYAENIIARDMRGFSAELFVDFSLTINVPELDFIQTLDRGYRFSLSTEVYGFMLTGYPAFFETIPISVLNLPFEMTFFVVVLLAAIVALAIYFFLLGIKQLRADPNEHKQAAKHILRRYANEIVVRDRPLNLTRYEIYRVSAFDELLKLAINLNRHIVAFHDDYFAQFAVLVDAYAYFFDLRFFGDAVGDHIDDVIVEELDLVEDVEMLDVGAEDDK